MAEAFDCPKCGAPMTYNAEVQGDQESITCPYCGETVIVPPSMRTPHNPQVIQLESLLQSTQIKLGEMTALPVITISNIPEYPTPAVESPRRGISGCLVAAMVVAGLLAIAGIISFSHIKDALFPLFGPSQNSPAQQVQTEIAPLVEKVTMTSDNANNPTEPPVPTRAKAPTRTPTPADTPTPEVDFSATAVESTRIAQNTLIETQRNWPAVVQEKFANDKLNWVIGKDNNNLAIEDTSIAGNKYTWKFTTKKSMGSFTSPDMPAQTDVYVSVDLQMSTDSSNTSDQAGIIFRHSTKDKSFYFFGVNPDGTYSLTLYDGSQWNDLIPVTQTSLLNPKQVNHIAVSIQDSQIVLVINDTVVDSFEDTQLSSGDAGLGVNLPAPGETASIIYTNFYVRAPKP